MTDDDVGRMNAFILQEINAAAEWRAARVASLMRDGSIFIAGTAFATVCIFLGRVLVI